MTVIRCPRCGHRVPDFFYHVAIDCEHDMTEVEIEQLLKDADKQETEEE